VSDVIKSFRNVVTIVAPAFEHNPRDPARFDRVTLEQLGKLPGHNEESCLFSETSLKRQASNHSQLGTKSVATSHHACGR
jgi:hypothetical protein